MIVQERSYFEEKMKRETTQLTDEARVSLRKCVSLHDKGAVFSGGWEQREVFQR